MDRGYSQDIEAVHRRLGRQIELCMSVLVGLFILTNVDRTYPTVRGVSGAEYNLLQLSEPADDRGRTIRESAAF